MPPASNTVNLLRISTCTDLGIHCAPNTSITSDSVMCISGFQPGAQRVAEKARHEIANKS
jgi:hypothetical protein